jgi:hypothetical protein
MSKQYAPLDTSDRVAKRLSHKKSRTRDENRNSGARSSKPIADFTNSSTAICTSMCRRHAICKFEPGAAAGFLGVICSFTGQIEQKRASCKGQA